MGNFRLSEEYKQEAGQGLYASNHLVFADLFTPFPKSWGFRGDPYLWGLMAARLSYENWGDAEALKKVLNHTFQMLTGHSLGEAREEIAIPYLNHGGMSGGMISAVWWREVGFPLLKIRHAAVERELQKMREEP